MRRLALIVLVLAWTSAHALDCNLNGVDDAADIAAGAASDCNANGALDVCDLFPLALVESRVAAGSTPGPIVAGALNDDATTDLAVANQGAGTVTILTGAGDGTFTTAGTIPVGSQPEALAAGVLIGGVVIILGSDIDLVVANGGANSLSVLRNSGTGSFSDIAGSPFTVSGHPNGVAIGDLNNDAAADIVVARRDLNGVSVMLNDGTGLFTTLSGVFASGTAPRDLVLGDFDADGFLDALVANRTAGTVSYLKNSLGLTFLPQVTAATIGDPVGLALADVDADADLDFAVLSTTDASVHVFLNNGSGTFSGGPVLPTLADGAALRLVDVDGNGAPDVVVVGTTADAVFVALNDGTGTFGARRAFAVGDGPLGIASGDVNGDGRVDLAISDGLSGAVSLLAAMPPVATDCDATSVPDSCEPTALDCNANGIGDPCDAALRPIFADASSTPLTGTSTPLAVGDVTGDGRAEVVLRQDAMKLAVEQRLGDGSLAPLGTFDVPSTPSRLLLLDVDGDTDRDYVVTTSSTAVYVLRNGGDGTVTTTDTYTLPNHPRAIVSGDFTGDGGLDLVTAYADTAALQVLAGTGLGIFTPSGTVTLGGVGTDLVAGDVDHDGDADLVTLFITAGPTTGIQVVRNNAGTLTAEAPILPPPAGTLYISLQGGDFDGDGDLDLAFVELTLRTGVVRLRIATNTAGTYAIGQTLPLAQFPGAPALTLPGLLGPAIVTDLDRDGAIDLALPGFGGNAFALFRNRGSGTFDPVRAIPVGRRITGVAAGDVDGDGAIDLVASTRASGEDAVAILRGLGVPDVDDNTNGVADCREETRCGDCADDEGDGLPDLADDDCAAEALTLQKVAIVPRKGRQPPRAKLLFGVPAGVTLDPAATGFGVMFATTPEYCGTPPLQARGKRALRLAAHERALSALTVQTLKKGGFRVKATIAPLDVTVHAGDLVRTWFTGGGRAFRGEATLVKHGKKLSAP
jgi:FG-GAP-like repeat